LTAHDVGLKDLLDSFYLLEDEPDIRLIAITINPHQTISMELSPPVVEAIIEAVRLVREHIETFLEESRVTS